MEDFNFTTIFAHYLNHRRRLKAFTNFRCCRLRHADDSTRQNGKNMNRKKKLKKERVEMQRDDRSNFYGETGYYCYGATTPFYFFLTQAAFKRFLFLPLLQFRFVPFSFTFRFFVKLNSLSRKV